MPIYAYDVEGIANPTLWFDDIADTYWVGSNPNNPAYERIEQFCGFLALHWLTNGSPAGGLTFASLDGPTRDLAVNTLRDWAANGARVAQVKSAEAGLHGVSWPLADVMTQASPDAGFPVGTRIWFGNDVHAEAARVTAADTYLMYDPDTGAATRRTAAEFRGYIANKNAFVVSSPNAN